MAAVQSDPDRSECVGVCTLADQCRVFMLCEYLNVSVRRQISLGTTKADLFQCFLPGCHVVEGLLSPTQFTGGPPLAECAVRSVR